MFRTFDPTDFQCMDKKKRKENTKQYYTIQVWKSVILVLFMYYYSIY